MRGSGVYVDIHEPPAEHRCVGVLPGEQEGCFCATTSCWEEGPDCCLCVCTEQQFSLLRVSGRGPGKDTAQGLNSSAGGLETADRYWETRGAAASVVVKAKTRVWEEIRGAIEKDFHVVSLKEGYKQPKWVSSVGGPGSPLESVRSSDTWRELGVELLHLLRWKEPVEVVWTSYQDAFLVLLEVFRAHQTDRRPRGGPRTCWRDYMSFGLGRPQDPVAAEMLLENVAGERDVWTTSPRQGAENGWIDGWH